MAAKEAADFGGDEVAFDVARDQVEAARQDAHPQDFGLGAALAWHDAQPQPSESATVGEGGKEGPQSGAECRPTFIEVSAAATAEQATSDGEWGNGNSSLMPESTLRSKLRAWARSSRPAR